MAMFHDGEKKILRGKPGKGVVVVAVAVVVVDVVVDLPLGFRDVR